jgi:transposase
MFRMAEPYAIELRQRIVLAYETGEGGYAAVAAQFSVGEATVKRWVWQWHREGHVCPARKGGGTPSSISLAEIEDLMNRLRDPTANELTVEFNRTRRRDARVHVSSMKRALRRCGYVVKKNAAGRWSVCAPTSSRSAPHT